MGEKVSAQKQNRKLGGIARKMWGFGIDSAQGLKGNKTRCQEEKPDQARKKQEKQEKSRKKQEK